ncbi:Hypothetical protein NGAL_HAMBI1146_33700 [Neorhizobium galegae bv. officinalis]|nr:Hypothetical protein NGAL_HAMBI1146_33700 [Neorhizobium galegae bv. officinalis]
MRGGGAHSKRPCLARTELGQGILCETVEFAFRIVLLDLAIPAFNLKLFEPERECFQFLSVQLGNGFLDLLQLCPERS